ncbi:MAG: dynamin family protein [Ruminococcus sp.]|jgi:ribosome biogenesis GTPase A|nr:dynamin family protein [Ruminococcus sp.]
MSELSTIQNPVANENTPSDTVSLDIEFVAGEIKKLISNAAVKSALGTELSGRLSDWDRAITARRTEPFSLVVIGDFKRGKSTVINAILGKNMTPVNVAPETFTINCISYGDYNTAEAVLKSGQRIPLTPEDLVRERLERLSKAFSDDIDHIDIKGDAELLKEIRIVDTPGLSDLDRLDKQVQDYLVNADAIVYIASALTPMSESEQNFLASYVRPQEFTKFFVLVNMIDAMNTMEDIQKIIGRITDRCQAIIPNALVYGVSGIDEYRRKIGLNRPDIKGFQEFYENEFLRFEMALRRELIVQKDTIKAGRIIAMLSLMVDDSLARINMIQSMSEMSKKKLDELAVMLDEEIDNLKNALEYQKPKIHLSVTEMLQQAEQWIYEFFAHFREDIVKARLDSDNEDIDKYFYSFLVDKVGEAYRKCIEVHKGTLDSMNRSIGEELSRKLGIADLAGGLGLDSTRLQKELTGEMGMVVADTVMTAARESKDTPLYDGFPAGTVSQFRSMLKKRERTDTIDAVLENYDDIRNNVVKDLKKAYDIMETSALETIDAVYTAQSEAGRDAVEQARAGISSESESPALKRHLQNAAQILESASVILSKYKVK